MFDFGPSYLRNAGEVEEKLIVQYLLPRLGYAAETWSEEVAFSSQQSRLQRLAARLLASGEAAQKRYRLLVDAKGPRQQLNNHARRLHQLMKRLDIDHGLLTNGRELQIHRRHGARLTLSLPVLVVKSPPISSEFARLWGESR